MDSLAQNGKPPEANGAAMNGDGPSMRHRSHKEDANSTQTASDLTKTYTAEQMEAVRKWGLIFFLLNECLENLNTNACDDREGPKTKG